MLAHPCLTTTRFQIYHGASLRLHDMAHKIHHRYSLHAASNSLYV